MQTIGSCVFVVSTVIVLTVLTSVDGTLIRIHFRNDITCYTCPEKNDNTECNRWAPDIPCTLNRTVCKTVHRINRHTGDSIQVDKMCALPEQCNLDTVGCTDTDNNDHIECVSCCSYSYCNIEVPYNLTTSLGLSMSVINSAASSTFIYWTVMTSLMTSLFVSV